MNTLLSLGHGYSARALAARLIPLGWKVIGTTRSEAKAAEIRLTGAEAHIWPGTDLGPLLDRSTHLLTSVAPRGDSDDPVLDAARDQITRATHLSWVGYLSTTGVYGDREGGWVDEASDLLAATKRGQERIRAEAAWQKVAEQSGLPLHIFRLAGIYGPGRGPFAKVLDGTARRIVKQNQVFSRIHVEDIATALQLSIQSPDAGAIYNLCDDDPAPPEDVIAYAADLLGQPLPPAESWETAEMTPMARSFYAESKRVRNDRIKSLGLTLRYPDYRAGLRALLKAERP
ncbi:SDR family oxidoreductase [Albirhodobacter sp. R86504]|uniref:SDR family oxidoreductase n=1 Tax=Albirhodobacter sp. R86504 TaxID=3093848 RepID=UPI00366CD926